MIDRAGRDRLALALRRLASGQITNDEYEDSIADLMASGDRPGFCGCGYDLRGGPHERCPECGEISDPALCDLAAFGWLHYSDLDRYRLRGKHALTREQRRVIARAIVFLKSDREYLHDRVVYGSTVLASFPRQGPLWLLSLLAILAGTIAGIPWLSWGGCAALVCLFLANWVVYAIRAVISHLRNDQGEPDLLKAGWPFSSDEEFQHQATQPRFLVGKAHAN